MNFVTQLTNELSQRQKGEIAEVAALGFYKPLDAEMIDDTNNHISNASHVTLAHIRDRLVGFALAAPYLWRFIR